MPPKFKLTVEQELEVVKRYSEGESIRKIAEHYPVGRTSIGYVLKRHNVKTKGTGNSYYIRKHTINHDFFETIDTEEKAYWLGFISADGHVSDEGVHIGLSDRDAKHLELFLESIGSNSNVKYTEKNKGARVDVYSKKMVSDLRYLDFYHNKTETQTFPSIDPNLRQHFIRGLFDGDGSFSISKRKKQRYKNELDYIVAFCGTEETMETLLEIIIDECNVGKVKIISSGNILRVIQWGGRGNALVILNWLYANAQFYLDRKHEKYLKFKEANIS